MLKKKTTKKKAVKPVAEPVVEETISPEAEEKKELLALYQKLRDMKITRISDIENRIARL